MRSVRLALANGALLTLMLGHFTNDMLGGTLPLLLPEMKERFGLSNAAVGLVPLAYTGMASLTQPLFGFFSDRYGRRWFASAALLWGASFVALYGFAPSYPIFLAFAALAGVASGAYHPLGASNAALVSDDRYKNVAMSLYTVGGTSGFALGPLVAVGLLALFGMRGTVLLLAPAIAVATLLLTQMGRVERARRARLAANAGEAEGRPAWG
ncbi:MAG: MFS transporter, partial [Chloroflexota bacterium]|nr:MFS transporter [Chloroflexota bacterium]